MAEVPVDLQISTGLIDLNLPRMATVEITVDGLSVDNFRDAGRTRDTTSGVPRAPVLAVT